jgi:hypothetical protein
MQAVPDSILRLRFDSRMLALAAVAPAMRVYEIDFRTWVLGFGFRIEYHKAQIWRPKSKIRNSRCGAQRGPLFRKVLLAWRIINDTRS